MFHLKDGWYFGRQENGDVRIVKLEDPAQNWNSPDSYNPKGPYAAEIVIEASGWASIISSVSINGEWDGGWDRAVKFHMNKRSAPMVATGPCGSAVDKPASYRTSAEGLREPIEYYPSQGISGASYKPIDLYEPMDLSKLRKL